jgi:hypothetical protein
MPKPDLQKFHKEKPDAKSVEFSSELAMCENMCKTICDYFGINFDLPKIVIMDDKDLRSIGASNFNTKFNRITILLSQVNPETVAEEVMHFVRLTLKDRPLRMKPVSPLEYVVVDEFFGRLGENFCRKNFPDLMKDSKDRQISKEIAGNISMIRDITREKVSQVLTMYEHIHDKVIMFILNKLNKAVDQKDAKFIERINRQFSIVRTELSGKFYVFDSFLKQLAQPITDHILLAGEYVDGKTDLDSFKASEEVLMSGVEFFMNRNRLGDIIEANTDLGHARGYALAEMFSEFENYDFNKLIRLSDRKVMTLLNKFAKKHTKEFDERGLNGLMEDEEALKDAV